MHTEALSATAVRELRDRIVALHPFAGPVPSTRWIRRALALALALADHRAATRRAALADPSDPDTARAQAFAAGELTAALQGALAPLMTFASAAEDATFQAVVDRPDLQPHETAWLIAQRRRRPHVLSSDGARAIAAVEAHGGRAWSQRWQRIAASIGRSGPPPQTLAQLDARWRAGQAAWADRADDVAEVATHLFGYRAAVAALKGVDPLTEMLAEDAVQQSTVDRMLEAAAAARPVLQRYLRARGRLVGIGPEDPIPPVTRSVPLPTDRGDPVGADQAMAQIIAAFERFHPALADLADRAHDQGWIDLDPRPNKGSIPTCVHFGRARQSRIVLRFDGSPASVLVLAHELGHAYHADVLFRPGPFLVDLPVSLAEGASLLAEGLVESALSHDPLGPLDRQLGAATTLLLDAAQTHDLELEMYAARAQGPLDPEHLSQRAGALQRWWFGPDLAVTTSSYWASQPMLYHPDRYFLALPYLVGFLFARRVLAAARLWGSAWAPRWDGLLRDSATATVEDLARTYLDVDMGASGAFDPVIAELSDQVDAFEGRVAAHLAGR